MTTTNTETADLFSKIRVDFSASSSSDIDYPAYAMCAGWGGRADAVAAAIARKNSYSVITLREDSRDENGPTHWQATLGTPCPGGGWVPLAEVWFSLSRPCEKMAARQEAVRRELESDSPEPKFDSGCTLKYLGSGQFADCTTQNCTRGCNR